MTRGVLEAATADASKAEADRTVAAAGSAIQVSADLITATLWIIASAVMVLGIFHLAVIDTVANPVAKYYVNRFALGTERVLITWFSAMMMSGAAILMLVAGLTARCADRANARAWLILAAVFVYLSFDEAISIHEKFGTIVKSFDTFKDIPTFGWVVAVAPLLIIGAVAFLPFLRRLPAPIGKRMVIAGLVFVLGAFVCELIGGYIRYRTGQTFWYQLEVIVEEGLEMAGLVLVIGAVLDYLGLIAPQLTIDFRRRANMTTG